MLLMVLIPSKVEALNEVNIFFFYIDECRHCSSQKAFMESIKKDRYPNIRIHYYNVASDENNAKMKHAKALYGEKKAGVPFTVIGDTSFIGFSGSSKCSMQKAIFEYSYKKYDNKFGKTLNIGYRTDLPGEVKEYKEEENYVYEEMGVSNKLPETEEPKAFSDPRIIYTIGLLSAIAILALIYLLITIRGRVIWYGL